MPTERITCTETNLRTGRWILNGCAVVVLAFAPMLAQAGDTGGGSSAARPGRRAIRVAIDILPDDPDNVVDPLHPGKVPVAILGTRDFDPRGIDPESLRLQGAPITKGADGSLVSFEDLNGDGRTDLVAL